MMIRMATEARSSARAHKITVRLSSEELHELKRRALEAGVDVNSFVLARSLNRKPTAPRRPGPTMPGADPLPIGEDLRKTG